MSLAPWGKGGWWTLDWSFCPAIVDSAPGEQTDSHTPHLYLSIYEDGQFGAAALMNTITNNFDDDKTKDNNTDHNKKNNNTNRGRENL